VRISPFFKKFLSAVKDLAKGIKKLQKELGLKDEEITISSLTTSNGVGATSATASACVLVSKR
jgi:hypothetical protein